MPHKSPAIRPSAVEKDNSILLFNVWLLVTPTVNIIGPSSSLAEYGGLMKPTVTSVHVSVSSYKTKVKESPPQFTVIVQNCDVTASWIEYKVVRKTSAFELNKP